MAKVEIYTKAFCPYCSRAMRLLTDKNVAPVEYDITYGGPQRAEMIERAKGRATVPQIFIDGRHIGGFDDMAALDRQGRVGPAARGMRAALLQMTSGIDPAANVRTLTRAIARAAEEGAAMIFTPEMSGLLDRNRVRATHAIMAEEDDRVLAGVRDAAASAGIWVHLGSLAIRQGDRWVNRGYVIDAHGAIRARYDKLHLFDVDLPTGESWRESAAYAPGEAAVLVDTPVGRLGLSICYDLRFPDLFRALSDAGAQVLAVPSAFTRTTGAAHWHVLLRARAIEARCFVIAAAQAGEHEDGRETFGHSLAVGPWGDVLVDMGEAVGLAFAELDPMRLADVRARIPALRHRRPVPPVIEA